MLGTALYLGSAPVAGVVIWTVMLVFGVLGMADMLTRPRRAVAVELRRGIRQYEHGDLRGAIAALRQAAACGYPAVAVRADFYLGLALSRQDDAAGAAAAYERALASGDRHVAPAAAVNLGALRESQGDTAAAVAAYRGAAESGHQVQAPLGLVKMASVLWRQGDLAEAEATARQALDYPPAQHTVIATHLLSLLAVLQGRPEDARDALNHLASSTDPHLAAQGHDELALWALATGTASPDQHATVQQAASAGDPAAQTFMDLVSEAMRREQRAGEGGE